MVRRVTYMKQLCSTDVKGSFQQLCTRPHPCHMCLHPRRHIAKLNWVKPVPSHVVLCEDTCQQLCTWPDSTRVCLHPSRHMATMFRVNWSDQCSSVLMKGSCQQQGTRAYPCHTCEICRGVSFCLTQGSIPVGWYELTSKSEQSVADWQF